MLPDYSASKGAIYASTKALASNLITKGARASAVAPGAVWTPLKPADSQLDRIASFGKNTDVGRPAQPERLSPAYIFMAPLAYARNIIGVVLPISGNVAA